MSDESKTQPSDQEPPPQPSMSQPDPRQYTLHAGSGAFVVKGSPAHMRITLDLTPQATGVLNQLLQTTGGDASELFRKALSLYQLAKEAQDHGKAVGIAGNPESLETEFVGL